MLRTEYRGEPGESRWADATEPLSPVITLEGVSKHFQNTAALRNISVTIPSGQFVAIIGRSGAGKTTLLHCLARTLMATAGSVRFDTCDLASLQGEMLRQHRARVGMIYQQFHLVKRLCVCDNVLIGRLPHLRGMAWLLALGRYFPTAQRDIALRCLEHVGLLHRAWQRTDTLSGGEQQRVAIAKVLAQQPQLILADEPVASLDLMNGVLVMDTLRRIASETGLTVIATLHHVEYARRYADRVLGLRDGELVFDGLPPALTDAALRSLFGTAPLQFTSHID
jgi:phosphonate transport system ATP-binding protein